jgi:Do/DeqQ family serine protease
MIGRMGRMLLGLLALLIAASPAAAQTRDVPRNREAVRLSFAPIVKKAAPAVVNVYSRRVVKSQLAPLFNDPFFRRFFNGDLPFGMPRERVENSLGSGVILDRSGLVVTNHHVIEHSDQITVVLSDRREFEAKILFSDEHSDLAVLKIDGHDANLPTLEMGDSDTLEVGDFVLAIGDPFGVGQTVTSGIVSGLARTLAAGDFRSFIQTDAAINPGNSGGALVDLDGKLVGINTAIFSQSGGSVGVGFAIPTALVRIVLRAANSGGRIVRPWLGASGQEVTAEIAESLGLPHPTGVLVKEVTPDGPAAKAGLKAGDTILAIAGHDIDDTEGLRFRLATLDVGKPTALTYWRSRAKHSIDVSLTGPPEVPSRQMETLAGRTPFTGATVGNLNPAFAEELGMEPTVRGVVVSDVAVDSAAQRLGLKTGDVLASLNQQPIENVTQLKGLLASKSSPWTIGVKRGNRVISVTVR